MPTRSISSDMLQRFRLMATLAFIGITGLLAFLLLTQANAQSTDIFKDVSSDNYFSEAIKALKDAGIVQGNPDGTYEPTSKINRAAFTTIVVRAINPGELYGKNCFTDVHEEWFAGPICYAKDNNIIDGFADGSFKPGDEITFSQAAKILTNTYKLNKGTETATQTNWTKVFTQALSDANAIPLSVEFLDEPVNRDEMAEMIYRLEKDIKNKTSRTYNEIKGEGLITVDSCKELQDRYERSLYTDGLDGELLPMMNESTSYPQTGGGDQAVVESTKDAAAPGGSGSYSGTNLQVEGVDEADIVKNDGKYIYILKGNSVRIVEAYPAENMKELVSISLGDEDEQIYPIEMYVSGDILTVIGSKSVFSEIPKPTETSPLDSSTEIDVNSTKIAPSYYQTRTKVFVIDVTDHTQPKVKRSVEFDGYYQSSRRIGNVLYAVVNKNLFYPYPYIKSLPTMEGDGSFSVPMMKDSTVGEEEQVAPCNQIKMLPKPESFNFLTVAGIPLEDQSKPVSREVIVGNTQNIYASSDNLYIAAPHWRDSYYYDDTSSQTTFYKFALKEGDVEYKSYGRVPGTILNQFSMDEKDNYFRVATSDYNASKNTQWNRLYVLDENLNTAGKIEGFASGENIYSVRFMGDRAYVVTFKQIDPLFVIDLSNAKTPKILGELKIPGFSNYLHPYDENHLIGFGNNVEVLEEDGVITSAPMAAGMKLSLFDVTDVVHPQELFKETIGDRGTYSDALYNHKALLFDKEKGLLAFPVTVYETEGGDAVCSDFTYSTCPSSCKQVCKPSVCNFENGIKICTTDCDGPNSCVNKDIWASTKQTFTGAYVYDVNLTDGFTLKGKITHLNEAEYQSLLNMGYSTAYNKIIQRILYIGENLYTVSLGMVKANNLDTLEEKNSATLAGDMSQIYDPIVY